MEPKQGEWSQEGWCPPSQDPPLNSVSVWGYEPKQSEGVRRARDGVHALQEALHSSGYTLCKPPALIEGIMTQTEPVQEALQASCTHPALSCTQASCTHRGNHDTDRTSPSQPSETDRASQVRQTEPAK